MNRTTLALTAAAMLAACDREPADDRRDHATIQALSADSAATPSDSLVAIAELRDSAGDSVGSARLLVRGSHIVVHIEAVRLPPGRHGVHLHETGSCRPEPGPFAAAGSHLDPRNVAHGLQSPDGGHAGDLPNLDIDANGKGSLRFEATELRPGTRRGEIFDHNGSALVIHADPDDQVTDPSGNSGARIACGVFTRS